MQVAGMAALLCVETGLGGKFQLEQWRAGTIVRHFYGGCVTILYMLSLDVHILLYMPRACCGLTFTTVAVDCSFGRRADEPLFYSCCLSCQNTDLVL